MTDNTLAPALLADIRGMIEEARAAVAATVNAGLTLLYWRIGQRINDEVLQGERAAYGREIVATLAQELTRAYGGGFTYSSLTRMQAFAEAFPDTQIVATLAQQLSWSHVKEILPLKQPLQREFYAEMCRIERWSVRTLRRQIDSMLYERTALSKKAGRTHPPRAGCAACDRRDDPRPGLPRPLPPRLPRTTRPLLRTRLGRRHPPGNGDVPAGVRRRVRLPGAPDGASRWTATTSTWTCSSTIAGCGGWWRSTSSWATSRPATKARWSCTCAGSTSTNASRVKTRPGHHPVRRQEAGADRLLELDKAGIHVAEYLTELPPRDLLQQKLHAAIVQARARLARTGKIRASLPDAQTLDPPRTQPRLAGRLPAPVARRGPTSASSRSCWTMFPTATTRTVAPASAQRLFNLSGLLSQADIEAYDEDDYVKHHLDRIKRRRGPPTAS